MRADRELPVVWAVAKGSALNKLILVPAALAISALLPWLVTPLLMLGGAYLCFEGVEKLAHKFLHRQEAERHRAELSQALADPQIDLASFERDKIKGAVRTDFILSAEIIVISLGTVAAASFMQQFAVLVGISVIMTVGVYGLVAGIVKLDDAGLYLSRRANAAAQTLGGALLWFAPWLMKALSVLGTAAMFLVGGGILVHGLPWLHHEQEALVAGSGGIGAALIPMAFGGVVGVVAGALALGLLKLAQRLRGKS